MKYRKKAGSSLILVIAIVGVLCTIGAVVCSAVLNTTRLNEDSKVSQDVTYAAESGIELGVSKIVEKKTANPSWEPITPDDKKITVSEAEFNSNNIGIDVDIEQEKDASGNIVQNRYKLTSKAKKGAGKEDTVKATVGQYLGNNNIFENVICSNNVDMSNGALHAQPGYMNIVNSTNLGAGANATEITSSTFTIPNYNFEKLDPSNENRTAANIEDLLTQLDGLIGYGVRKIEITDIWNQPYRVYLVNADNLNVEFTLPGTTENFIIISNGNVEFKFDGTMHFVKSSVISESFNVKSKSGGTTGGVTIQYPPFGVTGHSPLDKNKIDELNSKILLYASNWTNNTSSGSVSTNYWGTIDYEY